MRPLLVLLALQSAAFSADPLIRSDFDLVRRTVLVRSEPDPSKAAVLVRAGSAAGSGTCVGTEGGRSFILTNRHVVQAGSPLSVEWSGGHLPATLVAVDQRADLALLTVEAVLPVAPVAASAPPAGSPVRQWGRDWRGGGRPVFKSGLSVGFSAGREMGGAGIWVSTIPSISGDSGCGVFNEAGELVAVNWGTGPGEPQLAVGLADVVRFLRSHVMPKKKAAKSDSGLFIVRRPVWFTDYDVALKESAGKTVVVLFTDPVNCLPCRKLELGALSDPSVRDELARCVCVKLDVNSPAGQSARAKFAAHGDPVNSWPTLKVYRGGVRVADHVGDCSPDVLLGLIR